MTISGWRAATAVAALATLFPGSDALAQSPCFDLDKIETVTDATGCQMAALINAHELEEFQAYFDLDSLASRIQRLTKTRMYQEERYATVMVLAAGAGVFAQGVINELRDSGGYVLYLHGRPENYIERLLYRVDYGDQGRMNYIEFKIRRGKGGEAHIVDWYTYDAAAWASQQYADLVHLVFIGDGDSHAGLVGYEAADAKGSMEELSRLFVDDELEDAVAYMERLPASVRYARAILRLRLFMASKLDERGPYMRALADMATHFSKDPELGLMLLDHYLELDDYEHAHASIDGVDELINDDPVMYYLHAAIFLEQKDYANADTFATRATASDPTLVNALAIQFDARVFDGNFSGAVESLEVLRKDFNHIVTPESLAKDDIYKKFAESRDYRGWLERVSN